MLSGKEGYGSSPPPTPPPNDTRGVYRTSMKDSILMFISTPETDFLPAQMTIVSIAFQKQSFFRSKLNNIEYSTVNLSCGKKNN